MSSVRLTAPNGAVLVYSLSNQATTNPNSGSLEVIFDSGGKPTSSVIPTPVAPSSYQSGGEGLVNTTYDLDLIMEYLGNYIDLDGLGDTFAFTHRGGRGLDGEELLLVNREVVDIDAGGQVATLVVVPEPSVAVLLLASTIGVFRRRRK